MGSVRRMISFPSPKPSPNRSSVKRSAYKIRSTSLPVHFHPIVDNLNDAVASLTVWSTFIGTQSTSVSATWLADGATLVSGVLMSLSDLLNHPQAAEMLRNSAISDPFLDDLLRLADMQQSFRMSLINLLHLQAEICAGLRLRDPTRLTPAVRAHQRACREISGLASEARCAARTLPPSLPPETSLSPDKSGVATIPVSICDAAFALGDALAELMYGLAKLSDEAVKPVAPVLSSENPVKLMRIWWVVDLIRWKGRARKRALERGKNGTPEGRMEKEELERDLAIERLDGLETYTKALEISSGQFFRALVNARVCLLNILTPSI